MNQRWIGFFLLYFFPLLLFSQSSFTISGYVTDMESGETLIGANVYLKENSGKGTLTNAYGFYSLTFPEGSYTLVFSYLGYQNQEFVIDLKQDQRVNIELSEGILMDEVVVTAEEEDSNVKSTEMGTVTLAVEKIKKLPALLGEVDILKAIQLLPGVLSAGEGNAGFYVRGGGPDQNLVLLDEAVVYNSGHLLGFFSVFNADAIKNTTLIKGNMPAYYGGRVSSVVDVQMKDGNDKYFQVDGGIGLIASRLTVQGPILKERTSFIASARRTYALDLAQPFINNTSFAGTNYYFYDINAKINHRFSDKDRLYLSTYFGRDVLNFNSNTRGFTFNLPYGNETATLRWNHLFSEKLFMNVSAIYNAYEFRFGGSQDQFSVDVFSGVRDYNGKIDFDYYLNPQHHLKWGFNYTFHKLTPNIAEAQSDDVTFSNDLDPKYGHEGALYAQDEFKLNRRWSVNYGLRFSWFTQVGPYTSSITGREYGNLEPVKTYTGWEPRISGRFVVDPNTSIKAGFSMNYQYLHLVSNSGSTLPADIWVPSSELVEPQIGLQYAIGYFRNFDDNQYETSIEAYYKDLRQQIDYEESYVQNIAEEVETQFVFGTGESYGIELFFKKRKGRLNGWIGYTLSRTTRTFPDIKNGESYPAIYDRTHDLSVVVNYELSRKWELGGVFVYGTGNTFTPIRSLYFIEQNLNIEYGPRNSARLQDYHRVDFSATYTPKVDSEKAFQSSWTFSVYNMYNRLNPFFLYYDLDVEPDSGEATATAFKVSLFPIIPSVTWNFSWKQKKEKVQKDLLK